VAAVAVNPIVSVQSPSTPDKPRAETKASAPTAPELFARGIEAFRAGRYDEADSLWKAFVVKHPKDPRAEDVAFLRAVGRVRLGDAQGAATLARAYLDRFPRGMRRREAEAISRHVPEQLMETP
jgi:TolA-binding protein